MALFAGAGEKLAEYRQLLGLEQVALDEVCEKIVLKAQEDRRSSGSDGELDETSLTVDRIGFHSIFSNLIDADEADEGSHSNWRRKEAAGGLIDRLYLLFDTDRNGTLDYTELVSGLSVFCTAGSDGADDAYERLETVFFLVDKDGNGDVSLEELTDYLTAVFKVLFMVDPSIESKLETNPRALAELSASQAMQDCDLNDDGRLDYAEFGAWFLDSGGDNRVDGNDENTNDSFKDYRQQRGEEHGEIVAEATPSWEQRDFAAPRGGGNPHAPHTPVSPAQMVAEGISVGNGFTFPRVTVQSPAATGAMSKGSETSSESDWRAVLDSPSFNAKLQEVLEAEASDQGFFGLGTFGNREARTASAPASEPATVGGRRARVGASGRKGTTTRGSNYGSNGRRLDSPAARRHRYLIELFQEELQKQAHLAQYYYSQLARVRRAFTAKSSALVAAQEEISELKSAARQGIMTDQFDETCKKMAHHALQVAQKERTRAEKALKVVNLLQRDNEALAEQLQVLTAQNTELQRQVQVSAKEKAEATVRKIVEEEIGRAERRGSFQGGRPKESKTTATGSVSAGAGAMELANPPASGGTDANELNDNTDMIIEHLVKTKLGENPLMRVPLRVELKNESV